MCGFAGIERYHTREQHCLSRHTTAHPRALALVAVEREREREALFASVGFRVVEETKGIHNNSKRVQSRVDNESMRRDERSPTRKMAKKESLG